MVYGLEIITSSDELEDILLTSNEAMVKLIEECIHVIGINP